MQKYIEITADTNDGDYVSERTKITNEELEIIKPVIEAIREFNEDKSIKYQKYNWWDINNGGGRESEQYMSPFNRYVESGKCSEKSFDYFREFCPSGGDDGIHTIVSIILLEISEEIKLM